MIYTILTLIFAVAFTALPFALFFYLKKRKTALVKPLIAGALTWVAAAAVILVLMIPVFFISENTTKFIDDEAVFEMTASLAAGVAVAVAIVCVQRYALKDRRSFYETLAYSLGILAVSILYRAANITVYALIVLKTGETASFDTGAMFLSGLLSLVSATSLAATPVFTAWCINKKKTPLAIAATILADAVTVGASSTIVALGAPDWLIIAVLIPAALTGFFIYRKWRDFPEETSAEARKSGRTPKKDAKAWPVSDEDMGYNPKLFEKEESKGEDSEKEKEEKEVKAEASKPQGGKAKKKM